MAKCDHVIDGIPAFFRFSVNIKHTGPLNDNDVLWLCEDCYDRLCGCIIVDVIRGSVECLHLHHQKKQP